MTRVHLARASSSFGDDVAESRRTGELEYQIGNPPDSRTRSVKRHSYRRRRTSRGSTYVIGIRSTLDVVQHSTRAATPALGGLKR